MRRTLNDLDVRALRTGAVSGLYSFHAFKVTVGIMHVWPVPMSLHLCRLNQYSSSLANRTRYRIGLQSVFVHPGFTNQIFRRKNQHPSIATEKKCSPIATKHRSVRTSYGWEKFIPNDPRPLKYEMLEGLAARYSTSLANLEGMRNHPVEFRGSLFVEY